LRRLARLLRTRALATYSLALLPCPSSRSHLVSTPPIAAHSLVASALLASRPWPSSFHRRTHVLHRQRPHAPPSHHCPLRICHHPVPWPRRDAVAVLWPILMPRAHPIAAGRRPNARPNAVHEIVPSSKARSHSRSSAAAIISSHHQQPSSAAIISTPWAPRLLCRRPLSLFLISLLPSATHSTLHTLCCAQPTLIRPATMLLAVLPSLAQRALHTSLHAGATT